MAPVNGLKGVKPLEDRLPVINISALFGSDNAARNKVADEIRRACMVYGFFYVKGHGIAEETLSEIFRVSREFFARPVEEKMEIALDKFGEGGKGYFPMKGEMTSGKPDIKEGMYFGVELDESHPLVQAGFPMHGPNPFPRNPADMKNLVLRYMQEASKAAHALMEGIALSLGLDCHYFRRNYTEDPTLIFGILHYPSCPALSEEDKDEDSWGTGEHTDYGLLTLLLQDDVGGLQVKTQNHWVEGYPVEGALVCNIGDMLDRLTGGFYRSTTHRVKVNRSGRSRLSFPFFFDPGFDREVVPLPAEARLPTPSADEDKKTRWDGVSVHEIRGTYGEYFLSKISKAFPQLKQGA